jgi:nucleotide-binding universal stress UspA family protein
MATILLPTDFSDESFKAAAFAFERLGSVGDQFILLHAYLAPGLSDPLMPDMTVELHQVTMEGLQNFEKRCRGLAGAANVRIDSVACYGTLVSVIDQIGEERSADLVVIGTQGAGAAHFMGGNTADVVRNCELPVLTVPVKYRTGPFSRILLADDHHPFHADALKWLLTMARKDNSEIVITHVRTDLDKPLDTGNHAAFEALFHGLKHSFVTVAGDDVEETLRIMVDDHAADMVAVLHRQLGFFNDLFHRSMAKQLALHVDVPLLVLRDRAVA